MSGKPPGEFVTLTVDWDDERIDGPAEGDLAKTVSRGSAYHVLEVRRVRSTVHPCRWRVAAVKVDPDEVDDPDWWLTWWPRDRRR